MLSSFVCSLLLHLLSFSSSSSLSLSSSSSSLFLFCSPDSPSWFFPIAFTFGFVYLQPISSSPLLCLPFNVCHLAVKGVDLCPLFLIRSHANYFQFNLIFLFFGRVREREREREGREQICPSQSSLHNIHSLTLITHIILLQFLVSFSLSLSHSFTLFHSVDGLNFNRLLFSVYKLNYTLEKFSVLPSIFSFVVSLSNFRLSLSLFRSVAHSVLLQPLTLLLSRQLSENFQFLSEKTHLKLSETNNLVFTFVSISLDLKLSIN